jgi:branched-chain amino acid transport system permease protein
VRLTVGGTHSQRRVWWPSVSTAVAFTALCILPIVLSSARESYWLQFSTRVLLLGLLALSADLVWGYAGIFTLGHALLFGAGAYATGLLATRRGWIELEGLLPASVFAGGLVALAIGLFLYAGGRRVGGVYVSLATLALAYAAERLANGWPALGAANGIPGLPLPKLFGYEIDLGIRFYFVAFAAFVVGYVVLRVIARSQLGLALTAVRDDEERAEFLGYSRQRIQIVALVVSGLLAGMAGGLYGLHEGFVSPGFAGVGLSTQVLLWLVLGGRGRIWGALFGVVILEVVGRVLQDRYPKLWPVMVGAALLACITFLPDGIISLPVRRLRGTVKTALHRSGMAAGALH